MNFITKVGNFLKCLLHENCEYSIKKILTYVFSMLVVYLAIFTDKNYYDILIFIAGLLGIRGYERVKLWGKKSNEEYSEPEDNIPLDNTALGSTKPKKSPKKLLTD